MVLDRRYAASTNTQILIEKCLLYTNLAHHSGNLICQKKKVVINIYILIQNKKSSVRMGQVKCLADTIVDIEIKINYIMSV